MATHDRAETGGAVRREPLGCPRALFYPRVCLGRGTRHRTPRGPIDGGILAESHFVAKDPDGVCLLPYCKIARASLQATFGARSAIQGVACWVGSATLRWAQPTVACKSGVVEPFRRVALNFGEIEPFRRVRGPPAAASCNQAAGTRRCFACHGRRRPGQDAAGGRRSASPPLGRRSVHNA